MSVLTSSQKDLQAAILKKAAAGELPALSEKQERKRKRWDQQVPSETEGEAVTPVRKKSAWDQAEVRLGKREREEEVEVEGEE